MLPARFDMNLRQCPQTMPHGYHPDGDKLRDSFLSPLPDSGITALPENLLKARHLWVIDSDPLPF